MEVTQFTYFQQVGGIECDPVSTELTYGLERLAMYIQGVENVYDLDFNGAGMTYGDVFKRAEREFSAYNFEHADTELLFRHFADAEQECRALQRAPPAAAGLRPVHQGEPRVQSARCARRHLGDRARRLYRPRARARESVLRRLARRRGARLPDARPAARASDRGDPGAHAGAAADDLQRLVTQKLEAAGLSFAAAHGFVTPRRLALSLEGLPLAQGDVSEERRGPRVGSPAPAVEGFLKSAGLATLAECEERTTERGQFYFAIIRRPGRATAEVLPELLRGAIVELPWPKSMRFPAARFRWVRPLSRVVAIFDGAVLALALDGVPVGDETMGHRFLSKGAIRVEDFADYRQKLRKAHVVLDAAERKRIIERGLEARGQAPRRHGAARCGAARRSDRAGRMAGRARPDRSTANSWSCRPRCSSPRCARTRNISPASMPRGSSRRISCSSPT